MFFPYRLRCYDYAAQTNKIKIMSESQNPVDVIKSMSSDEISKLVLEVLGMKVEKLEEPNDRKESDFLAYYKDEIFLIEAKLKQDEKKEVAKRERVLSKGDVYMKDAVLGRDDTISGAFSNARDQLLSSAKVHKHDLRIILHLSRGINAKAKREKATDTLLGRTNILNIKDSTCKPCYFYTYSDFYTHRYAFDAAIVGYVDGYGKLHLAIYLNPHSPRYDKAKQSEFLARHAALDPVVEEANGRAYMPDANVSVKNSNDVINNLYVKYDNKMLQPFDFNAPEIAVRVSD